MRSTRPFAVVACVVLVAVAGCAGAPWGGPSTDVSTAASGDGTAGTPTAGGQGSTSTTGDSEFPAAETPSWLRADGVNATRLAAAHAATLEGTSYRVETVQNASGLYELSVRRTVRVDDGRLSAVERSAAGGDGERTRTFANDSWVVRERANATRTVYSDHRVGDGDAVARLDGRERIREYVAFGDFAFERVLDDGAAADADGGTLLEYRATAASAAGEDAGVVDYDGRLVVSTDGRVRSLSVTATQASEFGNVTTTYAFALEAVGGVSVARPDWLATARDRATTVNATYAYRDGVVAVEHRGPDAVPAGTRVVVRAADGVRVGTLAEPFERGETLHVAPEGDRGLALATGDVPATDAGFAGAIAVTLVGADGEVVARAALEPPARNGSAAVDAPVGERTARAGGPPATDDVPRRFPAASRWKQN